MNKQETVKGYCRTLGLVHTADILEDILHSAEKEEDSYGGFLTRVTEGELLYRQEKAKKKTDQGCGIPI